MTADIQPYAIRDIFLFLVRTYAFQEKRIDAFITLSLFRFSLHISIFSIFYSAVQMNASLLGKRKKELVLIMESVKDVPEFVFTHCCGNISHLQYQTRLQWCVRITALTGSGFLHPLTLRAAGRQYIMEHDQSSSCLGRLVSMLPFVCIEFSSLYI